MEAEKLYLKGMASISWFCCLHVRPTVCDFTASAGEKGLLPPITLEHHKKRPCLLSSIEEGYAVNRRQLILHTPVAAFIYPATVPNALALNDVSEDVRIYTDDVNKFKIAIPQEWQVGTGEPNGFKSVTAFYPEEASNSNVSIVITGLGPDFTRMESFGKVEEFAETLVSGLDRSWQRPPGVAAKLMDCKSSNGFYYIEYSLQNPGESRKHLFSAIGMASNGWYNRLYTVTGQVCCPILLDIPWYICVCVCLILPSIDSVLLPACSSWKRKQTSMLPKLRRRLHHLGSYEEMVMMS